MEKVLNKGFCEMSQNEIYETDGGVVICGVTIAGLTLLKIFGACELQGLQQE